MNCKLTNASAQQRNRQTFRKSLRLINQVRGENLLTTHRLSALYLHPTNTSYTLPLLVARTTPALPGLSPPPGSVVLAMGRLAFSGPAPTSAL